MMLAHRSGSTCLWLISCDVIVRNCCNNPPLLLISFDSFVTNTCMNNLYEFIDPDRTLELNNKQFVLNFMTKTNFLT